MHRGTILFLFHAKAPSRPPGLGWTSCSLDDRHALDFTGLEPLRHLWFKLRKRGGKNTLFHISKHQDRITQQASTHTKATSPHDQTDDWLHRPQGNERKGGIKNEMGGGFPKKLCTSVTSNLCVRVCDKEGSETERFWLESCLWFWLHGCVRLEAAAIIWKSQRVCVETKQALWRAL